MQNPDVKGIIFDFFGVLSSSVADEWFKRHALHLSEKQYRDKYLNDFDSGDRDAKEIWEELAQLSGQSRAEVKAEWVSLARIDWGMIRLFKELETQYKTAVCTNVSGEFLRSVFEANELSHTFTTLIVSSEVKMVKPEPAIYTLVLEKMELRPEQAVFVDDRIQNVDGAEALGMRGVHFTSLAELNEELKKLGVS